MFGNLGMWEVLILLFIVLLLFGAKRLPEIGGALGKGIREFKGSIREVEGEMREIGKGGDSSGPRSDDTSGAQQGADEREAKDRPGS
ncbi:MAG: twin-arginine translocase TatA/TatE family subunit [Gemmatimonadota bacterium]|nr:twin-arginine translocase TatA/TatE family subunit [Gemmatimonadota bacterium]